MRVTKTLLLTATAAASMLVLGGCGLTGTAATVGEETITVGQIQGEIVDFSESFDEPLPVTGDLAGVQAEFLTREINHLLLIELADQQDVEIADAEVDALLDDLLAQSDGDLDALRSQFVFTEDGLRRALEDEVRIRALEPEVGDVEAAVLATADEVGVEVSSRFGTWEGLRVVPGTGSISVPAG